MYSVKLTIINTENGKPINDDFITVSLPFSAIYKIDIIRLVNSFFLLLRRNLELLDMNNLYGNDLPPDMPF